ncbi:MAG: tRNA (adenosine(37)-N6)-threonylcarbamoyltransferase complex dimerization subunit type 1 TsaB [Buchnera aphidicola (Meitanaphis elongallis)]
MSETILAFDSSMSNCSVAVLHKNNVYSKNKICNKNQTKYILPMIKQALEINSLNLNEISVIIISKGPGDFIGIRTTIAVAQGLTLGLDIPIIAFSTISIMVEQAWKKFKKNKILILLKKNNTQVCFIQYVKNKEHLGIDKKYVQILAIEETAKKLLTLNDSWIIIGNCLSLFSKNIYKNLIFTNISFPQSKFIISLYLSYKNCQKHNLFHNISPIYSL